MTNSDACKKGLNISFSYADIRDYKKHEDLVDMVDQKTKGKGLNLLINNAGITSKYARITQIKKESLSENYEVNVIAPIMLTKAFIPLLEKAANENANVPHGIKRAAVINMSSILGSIAMNDNGGMYPYRCSKVCSCKTKNYIHNNHDGH